MHTASIVHLTAPLALGDLMPQIRKRDVAAELGDEFVLAILA
jgi:hypothetical protein